MKCEKTFYQEMKEAGLVTGSHCSDLYTKATQDAKEIADRHGKAGVLRKTFINQVTGELNFDFPFALEPYWEEKNKVVMKINGFNLRARDIATDEAPACCRG